MKRNTFLLFGLGLATLLMGGCEDADYSTLSDQAFIAQTSTNGISSEKITIGTDPVTTSVNVRLSDPTSEACSFRLEVDTTVLADYNRHNSTSYVALPEGQYSLDNSQATVEAGESLSSPID
ncbi:MAG: DUF1735 domain-containing protein, partial [Prevotella sp.]